MAFITEIIRKPIFVGAIYGFRFILAINHYLLEVQ